MRYTVLSVVRWSSIRAGIATFSSIVTTRKGQCVRASKKCKMPSVPKWSCHSEYRDKATVCFGLKTMLCKNIWNFFNMLQRFCADLVLKFLNNLTFFVWFFVTLLKLNRFGFKIQETETFLAISLMYCNIYCTVMYCVLYCVLYCALYCVLYCALYSVLCTVLPQYSTVCTVYLFHMNADL